MEKGQIVELTIEDMSSEGQGIGKTDEGFVVFVPGAVVGDRVKAKLTKVKKNYAFSECDEILERSEFRNEEFDCQICGGCPLGLLQYEKQLEIKETQVRSKLERLAGIEFETDSVEGTTPGRPVLRQIVGMGPDDNDGDGSFRYRNKAVLAISHDKHETKIGFNKAKSHDVIDCSDCLLQPLTVAAAVMATKEFIMQTKGWFSGMTVKTAFGTGQVMVVYDVVDKDAIGRMMPYADLLIDLLDEAIYNLGSYDDGEPAYTLESVALRYKKSSSGKGNVKGPVRTGIEILAGSNTIVDEVTISDDLTLKYEISPESFYQVNTVQMQRLYGVVREYCKRAINDTCQSEQTAKPLILDLYCGVGTIGLCVADLAEKVTGIEVVRDAVIDANRNAVINEIVNSYYVCGKAEEEIDNVLADANDREVIAILDPPRAGCKPELLEAIAKTGNDGVDSIVYVSCDPATLGRDLKLLIDYGYEVVEATPIDMFPHTGHVECVSLLQKHKPL